MTIRVEAMQREMRLVWPQSNGQLVCGWQAAAWKLMLLACAFHSMLIQIGSCKPFPPGLGSNARNLKKIIMTSRRLFFLIAIATAAAIPRNMLAQQTDVIRGRVTGPDSASLEGVTVTVTSISGNVSRTARTDGN